MSARKPLFEEVSDRLSDMILVEGKFAPGEKLPNEMELAQLFNTYHYRLYFFALESLRLDGRPEKAYQEHRKVLDAILDPEDTLGIHAYLAIVQHMESTRNIMLSSLAAE